MAAEWRQCDWPGLSRWGNFRLANKIEQRTPENSGPMELPSVSSVPDHRQQHILSRSMAMYRWLYIDPVPHSHTDALKKLQIREYGYDDTRPSMYEEDHLIPLALGGHPNDPWKPGR